MHRLSILITALRIINLIAKFSLSVFIAKRYDVESLGSYSLLVGAAAFAPAILGFGLSGTLFRELADAPRSRSIVIIFSKISFNSILYAFFYLLVCGLYAFDGLNGETVLYLSIVATEHVLADCNGVLVSKNRPMLANLFLTIRTGLWPIIFMSTYFLDQRVDFSKLFWVWLCSNGFGLFWLLCIAYSARIEIKLLRIDRAWLTLAMKKSYLFYVYDVGFVGYQFADRFIVGAILGLASAGIYSLYSTIVTSTVIVIYSSAIQPSMPNLIRIRENVGEFRRVMRSTSKNSSVQAIIASLIIFFAACALAHFFSLEAKFGNIYLLAIMSVSIVPRVRSELYHLVLYCSHSDIWMTSSAFAGMLFALLLTTISSYLFGQTGSAVSFAVSALVLLGIRWTAVRSVLG